MAGSQRPLDGTAINMLVHLHLYGGGWIRLGVLRIFHLAVVNKNNCVHLYRSLIFSDK